MSALAVRTGAINLGQGFPDTDGPAEVADAAVAIRAGHNQYPPGPGIPELRAAVARHQKRFWGIDVDPDREVLVTAGATEAVAAALIALCEVGDEVVALEPTYDSYTACAAMAGARLRPVTLAPPSYAVDVAALAAAIGPQTRLLLLNSPHNPTGAVVSPAEMASIARLCVENDLLAVTDEVYEHLVYDGEHRPPCTYPGMAERTVSISSAGKTFSFTGWKVGWATGPEPLVAAVRTAKQFLTYVNAGSSSTRWPWGSTCPTPTSTACATTWPPSATCCARPRGRRLRRVPPVGHLYRPSTSARWASTTASTSAARCPSAAWSRCPTRCSTPTRRGAGTWSASPSASARGARRGRRPPRHPPPRARGTTAADESRGIHAGAVRMPRACAGAVIASPVGWETSVDLGT